jgi:malate dehydrogenase (oxaloacetate-decarboxylating)(NADP+)
MASASWGWAISASAAWGFRSASWRCTRPVPGCRRSVRCRSRWMSAPTTTELLDDPLYLGLRQNRVRGADYDGVHRGVRCRRCRQLFPKCCMQWEDFANVNAVPILARYRDKDLHLQRRHPGHRRRGAGRHLCSAALRITGGSSPTNASCSSAAARPPPGIAELHQQAMALEGSGYRGARAATERAVRHQRPDGDSRAPISPDFQKPFAHRSRAGRIISSTAVKNALKPNGIIGVSTVPKLFNQAGDRGDGRASTTRPIIFPYSNPTSRSECTAEEAYRWSQRPGDLRQRQPVPSGGGSTARRFVPGQGNNVYIFPAVGMAVLCDRGDARHRGDVHHRGPGGRRAGRRVIRTWRPGSSIRRRVGFWRASLHVATKVAEYIFEKGLARVARPKGVAEHIRGAAYKPVYR